MIELPGSTGMTLTAARYLTPSGRSIQRHYSQGNNYEYFNQTGEAAGIANAFFEARTVTDRRVLAQRNSSGQDRIFAASRQRLPRWTDLYFTAIW